MKFQIRKATPSDTSQLREIGILSYGQYKPKLTKENQELMHKNLSKIELYNQLLHDSTCFVATFEDKIVGMAYIFLSGNGNEMFQNDWSFLRMIGVHSDFEGNGIARKLTQDCIDFTHHKNEKILALHTSEIIDTARHIYKSIGFVQQFEIPKSLGLRYWVYTLEL